MKNHLAAIFSLIFISNTYADTYQFYFPTDAMRTSGSLPIEWAKAKVINTSSYTTYDGKMQGYYSLDFTDLEAPATAANPGKTYGAAVRYDNAISQISILDFVGTNLKIRKNYAVDIAEVEAAPGTGYTYDLVTNINLATGDVIETILIANSVEAANIARAAGRNVILDMSEIESSGQALVFTSYSANVTNESSANLATDGGLMVKKVQASDGSSLVRQDSDGTLHIGENSVRISLTGQDRIDSSVGQLYIGNSSGHRTIVQGTLEIQEPTQPNHAATKNYVDSNFTRQKYVDSGVASAMAMTTLPKASNGESMVGVGVGTYGTSSAIALGLSSHVPSHNINLNANLGYSTDGKVGAALGAGWKF
jgi:YadA-like membrane anchor domain